MAPMPMPVYEHKILGCGCYVHHVFVSNSLELRVSAKNHQNWMTSD